MNEVTACVDANVAKNVAVSNRLHEQYIQYRGYHILVRCFRSCDLTKTQWTIQVDVAKSGHAPMLRHRDANHRFASIAEAEQAGFTWGRNKVDEILL
ncbi:hypothetical protein CF70_034855 [Cupriavidus sp. SK-3]|uniref:hypothetical protein n=1 Tax=Cupriavidus sp. SK-3 TaxID=1470558 RepID=UPI0004A564A3|nr:hypothetical protein [Cupriavidus sp. SK-3]KDP87696.1 hypothetical protein CF70_034855 [Cupriavidus sp. SK-3]